MTHSIRIPTILLSTFAALYGLSGCFVTIWGNGDATTQTHRVGSFDAIETSGPVDVDVAVGTEQSVSVRCDSNLHEYIDVYVDSRELVIDTGHRSLSPRAGCKATIVATSLADLETSGSGDIRTNGPTPDLHHVESTGSGDLNITEIGSAKLELSTTGSGDATIAGVTGRARLETTGSGKLHARRLVAQEVVVRSSGSGDAEVHATESVDISTTGSGDVDIWGTPESRHVSASGSGDVRYRD